MDTQLSQQPQIAANTVNIQVTLLELDYMLEQQGFSLYVTDKVAHQGEYPADHVIYWYWAQIPSHPGSHKLFDLATFWAPRRRRVRLSPLTAFMPDQIVTLHVSRQICDAETLAFIEGGEGEVTP